jgi:Mg2+/Co2+ transporter CorC
LHAEDVLSLLAEGKSLADLTPMEILHPPVVAPLTKKVDEMFDFFRENGVRAAVCLNEFGGVEGFITVYDVLSFIFGDISGETGGSELYQERDINIYEVPGEMKLTDFNNLTHFGLEDPRMTTIGGVAFRYLDRLPRIADRVVVEDVALTVLEMDAHRVSRVRVAKVSAEGDPGSSELVKADDSLRSREVADTTGTARASGRMATFKATAEEGASDSAAETTAESVTTGVTQPDSVEKADPNPKSRPRVRIVS